MTVAATRYPRVVAALVLAIATAAVFWPVVGHDFTNYDDGKYVTENRHVREGLTLAGLRWAWTTSHASNWHPLTWMSHMLDSELYGSNPGGHHLTSLLLHLVNTILLFLLLDRMTGAPWRSAFVALLFGIHPLHIESVAWVAERKDVLSTLFWLLTTAAYVRYAKAPSAARYLGVMVLLALGLCAKPMLVTLPFTFLLLDYWPLGRWEAGDSRAAWRLLREKLPLLPLAVASSVVTLVVQQRATWSLETLPAAARVSNAIVSYAAYLWKTAWPLNLAVFYPHAGESLPAWKVIAAALVLIVVTVFALRVRRRRPYVLVGWLWYVGTLVPVIGLVQVGRQALADRYTYVPLVGIFVILAWGATDVAASLVRGASRNGDRSEKARGSGPIVIPAVGVGLALMAVSWTQVGHWRDSVTLFEHALAVTDDNAVAHNNLGRALADRGRLDEAVPHYQEALRIDPRHVSAHNNLGLALVERGQPREAIRHYEEALRLDPGFFRSHNNLGLALVATGRVEEGIERYEQAIRIEPDYAKAHVNLGIALVGQGRVEQGVEHYEQALRLDPDLPESHNNLGLALVRLGRRDEALDHFAAAVRLRPGYAAAHSNMAAAYYLEGRYAEAWREIRLARRHGVDPPSRLIEMLAAKMPEPSE